MLQQVAPLRRADGSVPRPEPEAVPEGGGMRVLSVLPQAGGAPGAPAGYAPAPQNSLSLGGGMMPQSVATRGQKCGLGGGAGAPRRATRETNSGSTRGCAYS